jgi:site-specific DNA recombinase
VQVVFIKGPIGQSAEDELLLQGQGKIAEYERAKIFGAFSTRKIA